MDTSDAVLLIFAAVRSFGRRRVPRRAARALHITPDRGATCAPPPNQIAATPGVTEYDVEYPMYAVGEHAYQGALSGLVEAERAHGRGRQSAAREVVAMLIPEPGTAPDMDAVRVEIQEQCVGYLLRGDAAQYRSLLGQTRMPVRAVIVGDWNRGRPDRGFYGVRLALTLEVALRVCDLGDQGTALPSLQTVNRINARFKAQSGGTAGSTSVAVQTGP